MELIIHIDGGSRGNPGPAAVGIVLQQAGQDHPLHEGGYYLGHATNNVAEYQGLVRALELAQQRGGESLQIYSDSQLMVRQITGEYRVKSEDLAPLHEQAQMALLNFAQWRIHHVRREQNKRADDLVNLALDRGHDVVMEGGVEQASEADIVNQDVVDDTPHWTAQFEARPGFDCPAMCDPDREYAFGPSTPDGMCIHAAEVILEEGPLVWPPDQREGPTWCPRCNAKIILKRTN